MIDLSDWSPRIVRRLNLRLFDDPRYQYDLLFVTGPGADEITRRRIANVKDSKIKRLLDAVPSCPIGDETRFRDWWARWMPMAAGLQLWPDGNHRTGMMVAELVAEAAGFSIVLDADEVEQLRSQSKAIVVQRWAHGPQVTLDEFLNADHPLCRFYEAFKERLRFEAVSS